MRWSGFLIFLAVAVVCHAAERNIFENIIGSITSVFETYEEAPYSVAKQTEKYEERSYPARKWVCTEQTAQTYEEATNGMFNKLFKYITGNNDKAQAIKMTVPVSTQVTPETSGNVATYRMCFYIGQEHQANPPQPSDAAVFIEERPAMNIFTRTVGGYMTGGDNSRWLAEAANVKGFLDLKEEKYDAQTMWWVGYDAPWKFWNRRNEVWYKSN